MPHRRRIQRHHPQPPQPSQHKDNQPAPDPYDFRLIGPRSVEGVAASDLPNHGRGSIDTNPGKELARKPPARTGETALGEVGLRGTPDIADVERHGHRKRS